MSHYTGGVKILCVSVQLFCYIIVQGNKSNCNSYYRELFKLDFIPFSWYWNKNLNILFLFSFSLPLNDGSSDQTAARLAWTPMPFCLPRLWDPTPTPAQWACLDLASVYALWFLLPGIPRNPQHLHPSLRPLSCARHTLSGILFLLSWLFAPARMSIPGEQGPLSVISWLYLQRLAQSLGHNRCSVNICWLASQISLWAE